MKKILLLLLLLFIEQISFAQTPAIDSLNRLLSSAKQDTSRTIIMANLCQEYSYLNPDTAIKIAQQGFSLAHAIGYPRGEAACLLVMATVFSQTGNNAKSLDLSLRALKKAEKINDTQLLYIALTNIDASYYFQRDFNKALYYELKTKDLALDTNYIAITFENLGDIYEKLNQLDSARFYTERGYDLSVKLKDTVNMGSALNILGKIYAAMHQPAIAMDNYKLSLPYIRQFKDYASVGECLLGMAKIFQEGGRNDSCLYYAKEALQVAKENHISQMQLNATDFLAAYYKHINIDSAYTYLSGMVAIRDSIFSEEKSKEMENLSFDENMRQQEIAANKMAEEHARKNNLELIGITAGLIILISLFFVMSRSVIVHERWLKFLGILGLLVVFEYFYILVDPYVVKITNESPLWMLLCLLLIAVILEPIHNRIEHWITHKVIMKNKKLKLEAAKKTVARLENEKEG